MRQLAEGGHVSPRQQTPDAGTPSSSSIVRMPGTGQVTPVCLPLLSQSNQLLWVYSNQIELPAASVAELNKAFDRFPYLTDKQSTELAQCCSLHPDEVKVWFMAQRVQYGISWDCKDIADVWNKFRSNKKDAEEKREVPNEMDKEMQENQRKIENQKNKDEESEEKVGEEKSLNEGTTMEQKLRANENLERKSKQKQPAKKVEPRKTDDNTITQNKRKQGSKIENRREKRVKQDNDDERETNVEIKMDKSENESKAFTESEGAVLNRKKRKAKKRQSKTVSKNPSEPDVLPSISSFLQPIPTLNIVPLTENQTDPQHRADASLMNPANVSFEGKPEAAAGQDLRTEASDSDILVTAVDKLKELTSIDGGLVPADDPPAPVKQDADEHVAPARARNKTQTQLAKLKTAFLHCQYPDVEQYTWLAEEAEISRTDLVQWFGDMRYALKRARPRWMTAEQYKQALGNIKYHQYLNKQKRLTDGLGYIVKKLEGYEHFKEEEKEEAWEVKTANC